tara:strand:- start:3181 stop:4161 length:981 start_codon:yes stop_codon:yes gene_type:complete
VSAETYRYSDTLTIESGVSGQRLDRFLQDHFQKTDLKFSRSKCTQLIEQGFVSVNGLPSKSSYKLKTGDQILLTVPHPEANELKALELEIPILYEDEHCLVVHKPAGLVVHPAAGHAQDTLVNAILGKIEGLKIGFNEKRPGIVHRLDKDTSGILVVAKTERALESLGHQFKEKSVHRIYYALVYGTPIKAQGRIQTHLERHPVHRKKFHSGSKGKIAITHYQTLKSSRGISLIQCKLETGRTHQIRVHMSEMECPIVGDPIYSTSRRLKPLSSELIDCIRSMKGIGLHARELGFHHPITNEFLLFKENWPENLTPLVSLLGFKDV